MWFEEQHEEMHTELNEYPEWLDFHIAVHKQIVLQILSSLVFYLHASQDLYHLIISRIEITVSCIHIKVTLFLFVYMYMRLNSDFSECIILANAIYLIYFWLNYTTNMMVLVP
ncbi:hypothetical protein ACJX0J_031148 [Zea mays]